MRELEFIPDSLLQPSSDKMAFIDRLANSITKRKRSTPQKFVGEHFVSVQTGQGLKNQHLLLELEAWLFRPNNVTTSFQFLALFKNSS